MTPPFQAFFACAVAPARYARLRDSTRWSYPIYRNKVTPTTVLAGCCREEWSFRQKNGFVVLHSKDSKRMI